MVVTSRKILSPANDSWFSDKYIENKGKLYKCRVCPGQRWKNRISMAQHQRMGVAHNRLVEAAKRKEQDEEQVSEDSDEDDDLPIYHLEEPANESIEESTPPPSDGEEQQVDMEEERAYDSTPSMLDDTHMESSEEPEISRQSEQPNSGVKIERCVYSAEKTNGYHYCLWCGTPETPLRRYRRCKRWYQDLLQRHGSNLAGQVEADA
ncbi:hypothetical protein FS749_001543 [Ceratobasidium sp. UAMH 11750]|nr:hypothetical protein FS749_001543 [Ceratobasidium sp. UAMH 11750]